MGSKLLTKVMLFAVLCWVGLAVGISQISTTAILPAIQVLLIFLCGWAGIVYLCLAVSYTQAGGDNTWLFVKDIDRGSVPLWNLLLLSPYYIPLCLILWLRHRLLLDHKETPWAAITPEFYLGRYPLDVQHEFPPWTRSVVDLTAELPERGAVVAGRNYLCLPSLDCDMPNEQAMLALAAQVASLPAEALPAYIHCANGHGRSSSLLALVLLLRGEVSHWREAFKLMKAKRPGVNVHRNQELMLDAMQAQILEAAAETAGTEGAGVLS